MLVSWLRRQNFLSLCMLVSWLRRQNVFFSLCMLVSWLRRQNFLFPVYVSELAQETECFLFPVYVSELAQETECFLFRVLVTMPVILLAVVTALSLVSAVVVSAMMDLLFNEGFHCCRHSLAGHQQRSFAPPTHWPIVTVCI